MYSSAYVAAQIGCGCRAYRRARVGDAGVDIRAVFEGDGEGAVSVREVIRCQS
jgi:hypothetical protein